MQYQEVCTVSLILLLLTLIRHNTIYVDADLLVIGSRIRELDKKNTEYYVGDYYIIGPKITSYDRLMKDQENKIWPFSICIFKSCCTKETSKNDVTQITQFRTPPFLLSQKEPHFP